MPQLQATKRLIGVKWFNAAAVARVPAAIEAEQVNCRGLVHAHIWWFEALQYFRSSDHPRWAVLLGSRAKMITPCIAKGLLAKHKSI